MRWIHVGNFGNDYIYFFKIRFDFFSFEQGVCDEFQLISYLLNTCENKSIVALSFWSRSFFRWLYWKLTVFWTVTNWREMFGSRASGSSIMQALVKHLLMELNWHTGTGRNTAVWTDFDLEKRKENRFGVNRFHHRPIYCYLFSFFNWVKPKMRSKNTAYKSNMKWSVARRPLPLYTVINDMLLPYFSACFIFCLVSFTTYLEVLWESVES